MRFQTIFDFSLTEVSSDTNQLQYLPITVVNVSSVWSPVSIKALWYQLPYHTHTHLFLFFFLPRVPRGVSMETRKRQRSVSQQKVCPVREGGSAEILQQAGCKKHDIANSRISLWCTAAILRNVRLLQFIVYPRSCQGQRSQGNNENRNPQCHLPACQDWQPLRTADHLPERQQHKEHLCLPQRRQGTHVHVLHTFLHK